MKKIFLFLALLSATASVAIAADSMNATYDPDQITGTPVMVMMSESKPDSPDWFLPTPGNPFALLPPIKTILVNLKGSYGSSFRFVIASPNGDISATKVDLKNLDTGEAQHIHYTQAGPEFVTVSNPDGRWWIVIRDVSGAYYSGTFSADWSGEVRPY